jgi:hypothetical protein
MLVSDHRRAAWIAFSGCVLFMAIYARCLTIQAAGDDWLLIHPARALLREYGLMGALVHLFIVSVGDFYRPLALVPMLAGSAWLGLMQALKLATMILLLSLVVRCARRIGLNRIPSVILALAVILHQVFASVVTEVDLWGDVLSALAFVILLDCCLRYCLGWKTSAFLLSTALATTLCILAKEAGVVCFLIPLLFLILRPYPLSRFQRKGFLLSAGILLVVSAAYFAARQAMGLHSTGASEGYYSLSLGINVLKNFGLAVGALLSPVNTVEVAMGGVLWKSTSAFWVLLLTLVCVYGLYRTWVIGVWRLPLLLFAVAFISQGPVLLMPHLTEANFTRAIAPGLLGAAMCLRSLPAMVYKPTLRIAGWVLCAVWFAFDLSAVYAKSTDIIEGQKRAHRFRMEIVRLMPDPPRWRVLVAVLDPGYVGYSVYRQPLFEDIRLGEVPFALQEIYAPKPVEADFVLAKNVDDAKTKAADFLVYDNGSILDLRAAP